MERVFRHFQEDLDGLKERLLAMGGLAEERVRESVHAIKDRDAAAVEGVLSGDEPINDLHMEIDDRCFKLLALHQPMAADLRVIVAAVKINTDLERVGDLAVNIAEAGKRYLQHAPVKPLIDIPRMGELAQKMLRDALDAFVRRDMALAEAVLAAAAETGAIVTAEEHHLVGGLGGAVADLLAVEQPTRMRMIGMPDEFASIGPTGRLRAKYGMSAEAIAEACRDLLRKYR